MADEVENWSVRRIKYLPCNPLIPFVAIVYYFGHVLQYFGFMGENFWSRCWIGIIDFYGKNFLICNAHLINEISNFQCHLKISTAMAFTICWFGS